MKKSPLLRILSPFALLIFSTAGWAVEPAAPISAAPVVQPSTVPALPTEAEAPPAAVQPMTKAEIEQGIQQLRDRQNQRIEAWGKTLKPEDFERTWSGRILKQPKRQEVCGIYQDVVNETYNLALQNKLRLPEADQKQLQDRNQFIQGLGYKHNIVDTRMGFNCRLR